VEFVFLFLLQSTRELTSWSRHGSGAKAASYPMGAEYFPATVELKRSGLVASFL
jgi:hypothetical protein